MLLLLLLLLLCFFAKFVEITSTSKVLVDGALKPYKLPVIGFGLYTLREELERAFKNALYSVSACFAFVMMTLFPLEMY